MSSSVVGSPKENRSELLAISGETPMAKSTWEGSGLAELQAAPVATAT